MVVVSFQDRGNLCKNQIADSNYLRYLQTQIVEKQNITFYNFSAWFRLKISSIQLSVIHTFSFSF